MDEIVNEFTRFGHIIQAVGSLDAPLLFGHNTCPATSELVAVVLIVAAVSNGKESAGAVTVTLRVISKSKCECLVVCHLGVNFFSRNFPPGLSSS